MANLHDKDDEFYYIFMNNSKYILLPRRLRLKKQDIPVFQDGNSRRPRDDRFALFENIP